MVGTGKAVPVLKHHAMKTNGEGEVNLHGLLTLALDGQWANSHPSPEERALCTKCKGGWVSSKRTSLGAVAKEKIADLARNQTPVH